MTHLGEKVAAPLMYEQTLSSSIGSSWGIVLFISTSICSILSVSNALDGFSTGFSGWRQKIYYDFLEIIFKQYSWLQ